MDRVHSGLIERLEAAEVGSRELDAGLEVALGLAASLDGAGRAKWASGVRYRVPHYTTSLDAARALAERVLPGWQVGVWTTKQNAIGSVLREGGGAFDATSSTPALALCIATLKAKTARYEPQANGPNQSQHKREGE